jgi:hypothetical protein
MSKVTKSNIYAVLGSYGVSKTNIYAVLGPEGVTKANAYVVLGPKDKGISKTNAYVVLDAYVEDPRDLWVDDEGQFVDIELQWYEGYYSSKVYIDDEYYYKGVNNLLEIYSIETRTIIKTLTCESSITHIWSNGSYIFLATDGGVLYVDKQGFNYIVEYKQYPEITSNMVNCIDGGDGCLLFSTFSGIDFFDEFGCRCYTSGIRTNKCFYLNRREIYYSNKNNIYRSNPSSENLVSDVIFTTGSGVLSESSKILDFKVSKINNEYNFFVLTDLYLYAIDSYGYKTIEYDNMFKIDLDYNTTRTNGKLYITTNSSYIVVNMSDDSIYDMYRVDFAGRSGDTLYKSLILDSNK